MYFLKSKPNRLSMDGNGGSMPMSMGSKAKMNGCLLYALIATLVVSFVLGIILNLAYKDKVKPKFLQQKDDSKKFAKNMMIMFCGGIGAIVGVATYFGCDYYM